jgi:hypothetical protein
MRRWMLHLKSLWTSSTPRDTGRCRIRKQTHANASRNTAIALLLTSCRSVLLDIERVKTHQGTSRRDIADRHVFDRSSDTSSPDFGMA